MLQSKRIESGNILEMVSHVNFKGANNEGRNSIEIISFPGKYFQKKKNNFF